MSGKTFRQTLVATCALILSTAQAPAQGLFDPVAQVDQRTITEFEVQQRQRFLRVLGASGGSRSEVIEELIRDRLREAETRAVGIILGPDELAAGLAEFAGRADLSTEEFIQGIASEGIAEETFRDFVNIQLVWRDYIRARFGSRVSIDEREIDRAVQSTRGNSGIEVLVSEIIIPAPPQEAEQVLEQAEIIAQTTSEAEFSSFARQFSATASRDAGGRLPWTPISELPPVLRPLLLALGPGDVTAPLQIPNAVALFQLRDIRETEAPQQTFSAIEYAAYYINGGRTPEALSRAQSIAARVDRCDDLYGIAQGQDPSVLDRGSLPPDEIPNDIAIELSKLDPGEVSTTLTRANGNTLVFLMLCGRTPALEEDQEVDRGAVATQLRNQRLNAFSETLLAELRAEADVRILE
ncbi:peptidylprolyl isomerase [Tateyamaria sp. ANG-S1]|uniref:peptidylprolyl isomerase n=1 Tax=Tateyamaria sp. ANG-S1 TaxID=1577905 RepID=UPI00057C627E|nr:peptidylprolyl isomerase [Tateyamaria sp. ANG-S1]KIC49267.1 peptidylprolyl isomerase [Tateyamaria sp. ANG-S1]